MDDNYSEMMLEHYGNPRNNGIVPDADGVGEVGNPVCGDMMKITIKVDEDGTLADVRWKTLGCGAALATSSMMSELAKGMSLQDAMALSRDQVAQALGGMPKEKLHCSNLAADGLHAAIRDFLSKHPERAEGVLSTLPPPSPPVTPACGICAVADSTDAPKRD